MTERERQALRRVRAQVMLVHRLSEQLREQKGSGLRSARLDGMPKGQGGMPIGLDGRIARKEALERIVSKESAQLLLDEKAARRAMEKLRPELYAFCALYYLSGLSLEETAAAIDRSERQCTRYRREIESMEEGENRMPAVKAVRA
ncbi:MAG: hypothetical protein Q4F18_13670 [Clostridia bacterium]|nr:hypothetical protein [Clostridia bacterium]